MKTRIIIFLGFMFGAIQAQTNNPIKVYGEQSSLVQEHETHAIDTACAKRMSVAQAYMKGFNHAYNPAKAFDLYLECATMGVPQAMNAIGIMYNKGIGAGMDNAEAMRWFEKAANLNYAQSWYNLGLMYKFAQGVPQDFTKAYDCFKRSSDLDFPTAYSYQGYLFYKGLGVEQNYTKAFELFQKAAEKNRPSGMYYLGLCYRNGYGVARDTVAANFWLKKSAKMGYHHSEEELATSEPENIAVPAKLKSVEDADDPMPVRLKRVRHHIIPKDISGIYSGYVITYDWSGEHAVSQAPLVLQLTANGKEISGQWIENNGLSASITATLTDTGLNFTDAQYRRPDHYNQQHPLLWQFKKASIEVIRKDTALYLAGNIQFYLPEKMEPGKPMYISLKQTVTGNSCGTNCTCGNNCTCTHGDCCSRTKKGTEKAPVPENIEMISDVVAFPNPFSNNLNLSFTLNSDSEVKALVFKMDGSPIFQTTFGQLKSGRQTQALDLTVPAGVYLVKLKGEKSEVTTIVVKQ